MRILGKEFSHLIYLPHGLWHTQLHIIHLCNWYLVININQEANKANQKENHRRQPHVAVLHWRESLIKERVENEVKPRHLRRSLHHD